MSYNPETKRFEGYYDNVPRRTNIPQCLQVVTIPKGTVIRSTHPKQKTRVAGRNFKVQVFDFYPGQDAHTSYHGTLEPAVNPSVVWVGSGSYWNECDVNDCPEVQAWMHLDRLREEEDARLRLDEAPPPCVMVDEDGIPLSEYEDGPPPWMLPCQ